MVVTSQHGGCTSAWDGWLQGPAQKSIGEFGSLNLATDRDSNMRAGCITPDMELQPKWLVNGFQIQSYSGATTQSIFQMYRFTTRSVTTKVLQPKWFSNPMV